MSGIDEFFDRLELSLMAMINQDSEQRVSAILSASGPGCVKTSCFK
jgi:hypothetical protein